MATTTYNPSFANDTAATGQSAPSFFGRIAQRYVDHQTAKARQRVVAALEFYTDEQLLGFGWTHEDIARLRRPVTKR